MIFPYISAKLYIYAFEKYFVLRANAYSNVNAFL